MKDEKNEFISGCCEGERCSVCGEPPTHKLGEEILSDDPFPDRHNLTAYVCRKHFNMIVRPHLRPKQSGLSADDMIKAIIKLDLIYARETSEISGLTFSKEDIAEAIKIGEYYDKQKAEILNQFASTK